MGFPATFASLRAIVASVSYHKFRAAVPAVKDYLVWFDMPGEHIAGILVAALIAENPGATFYHASTGEGVIFLYSRDNDKGLWYLPGSGLGPLSEGDRQLMKKARSPISNGGIA